MISNIESGNCLSHDSIMDLISKSLHDRANKLCSIYSFNFNEDEPINSNKRYKREKCVNNDHVKIYKPKEILNIL